jgi:hypothetical protein
VSSLNLTAAKYVHIIEPQWNPMVEEQAIGRVVRLDQRDNPTVIRYFVKDTVEKVRNLRGTQGPVLTRSQQIQDYQRNKKRLAASGFGTESEPISDTELLNVSGYLPQSFI